MLSKNEYASETEQGGAWNATRQIRLPRSLIGHKGWRPMSHSSPTLLKCNAFVGEMLTEQYYMGAFRLRMPT